MNPRGKGHLEDRPELVQAELVGRHISNLVGAMAPVREAALDYTGLLPEIPDQGPTSSCVGQALATSLFLCAKLAGIPIPRPSAKAIYDFAREEDSPYMVLRDSGSRPLAAIKGAVERGLVADSTWPIQFFPGGVSNINDRPPLDVYQDALGAKLGSYYRIAPGSGASSLVRHALARGYFPIFAMPVDQAYEDWSTSKIYEGRAGRSLGGHMQAIAGFEDGRLIVPGSWGPTFASGGVVRIANDYFDSGECTDIIVPTAIPAVAA